MIQRFISSIKATQRSVEREEKIVERSLKVSQQEESKALCVHDDDGVEIWEWKLVLRYPANDFRSKISFFIEILCMWVEVKRGACELKLLW